MLLVGEMGKSTGWGVVVGHDSQPSLGAGRSPCSRYRAQGPALKQVNKCERTELRGKKQVFPSHRAFSFLPIPLVPVTENQERTPCVCQGQVMGQETDGSNGRPLASRIREQLPSIHLLFHRVRVFVGWTQQAGWRASCGELAAEASALETWGSICLPN